MKFININNLVSRSKACTCDQFTPLEFEREVIDKRIKASKGLKKGFELITDNLKGQKLYQCPLCKQFWQSNWAWNWGNKEYLFKVPAIKTEDWIDEPYMAPDEMLLYTALMSEYFEKNELVESTKQCTKENCNNKALINSVLCKDHFIQNLQGFNLLPRNPSVRLFEPYY